MYIIIVRQFCKIKLFRFSSEIQKIRNEKKSDGNKRIVDPLVRFSSAESSIYVEKWKGQLVIEIDDTHPVDNKKIC